MNTKPTTDPVTLPVQTTFRHMAHSPAVAERVEAEAQKLLRFYPRITFCNVVIEAPHRHHVHGWHFAVHIEVGVPRARLVSDSDAAHHPPVSVMRRMTRSDETAATDKDIYVVIRHAFDSAKRRLAEHARKLRGEVKRHESKSPVI